MFVACQVKHATELFVCLLPMFCSGFAFLRHAVCSGRQACSSHCKLTVVNLVSNLF